MLCFWFMSARFVFAPVYIFYAEMIKFNCPNLNAKSYIKFYIIIAASQSVVYVNLFKICSLFVVMHFYLFGARKQQITSNNWALIFLK